MLQGWRCNVWLLQIRFLSSTVEISAVTAAAAVTAISASAAVTVVIVTAAVTAVAPAITAAAEKTFTAAAAAIWCDVLINIRFKLDHVPLIMLFSHSSPSVFVFVAGAQHTCCLQRMMHRETVWWGIWLVPALPGRCWMHREEFFQPLKAERYRCLLLLLCSCRSNSYGGRFIDSSLFVWIEPRGRRSNGSSRSGLVVLFFLCPTAQYQFISAMGIFVRL